MGSLGSSSCSVECFRITATCGLPSSWKGPTQKRESTSILPSLFYIYIFSAERIRTPALVTGTLRGLPKTSPVEDRPHAQRPRINSSCDICHLHVSQNAHLCKCGYVAVMRRNARAPETSTFRRHQSSPANLYGTTDTETVLRKPRF